MAFAETPFQQMLDQVARFVREHLMRAERRVARQGEVPAEILDGLRQLGVFGLTISERWGGLGH